MQEGEGAEREGIKEGRERKRKREGGLFSSRSRDWKREWRTSENLAPFHFPRGTERKDSRTRRRKRERKR